MRVQFALCAQTVSVDRVSNRISIFNVVDHIATPALPIIVPTITFVAIVESEREESVSYKGSFEVRTNDNVRFRSEVPVNFVNGQLARVVIAMNGVRIQEYGTLSFRFTIPDKATAEVQLPVVNVAQKVPAAPTATTTVAPTTHS